MITIDIRYFADSNRMEIDDVTSKKIAGTTGDDNATILNFIIEDSEGILEGYGTRVEFDVYVTDADDPTGKPFKPYMVLNGDNTLRIPNAILSHVKYGSLPIQLAFKKSNIRTGEVIEFYSLNKVVLSIVDAIVTSASEPLDITRHPDLADAICSVVYDRTTSSFFFTQLDGGQIKVHLTDLSEEHFEVQNESQLILLNKAEDGDTATTLDNGKWYKLYGLYSDINNWKLMSSFRYGYSLVNELSKIVLKDADGKPLSEVPIDDTPTNESPNLISSDAVYQSISTERSERQSADATLQSNIDTVQSNLDNEISNRESADTTLQNNIDTEIANRTSADETLQSNIDAVQSNLTQEIEDRTSADTTLQNNIDTVQTNLTQEISNRKSADTTLQNNIDTVQSNLDSEISTRESADTTLQNNIDTVQTNLTQEISNRESADATLQDNIDNESTARANADTTLQNNIDTVQSNLDSEISTRKSADTTLQNNIDAVQSNLDTEISNRTSADATLQNNINGVQSNLTQEIKDRTDADETLQNNIDSESTARSNADTNLQNNINAEISNRKSADTTLQNNIDTEISTRKSADTTLQNNIDAVQSNLTQEIEDRTSADETLQSNIETVQTNLDAEISTRKSADTTLQNNIDAVQSNLDSEISNRAGADETLQNNIDTEIANRKSADTTLQNNINSVQSNLDTEISDRTSADTTISTNLSNHINDKTNPHTVTKAQVGLGNVDNTSDASKPISTATQNALNTLTTAVETAQSDIDAEVTARASADTTLQSNIDTEASTRANEDSAIRRDIETKQDKLTAGTNITISDNTISAKDTTYGIATTSSDGLMSKDDKTKLDSVSPNAQVNVIESINLDGVTQAVSNKVVSLNLSNYATKSDISTIPKFAITVVQTLPTTDISDTTIYLVPNSDVGDNLYNEYIYVNNAWEKIGSLDVDMSEYVAKGNAVSSMSASGRTITYIMADGNTGGTVTIQDTDTKYSAGTGLSLNGTTFNHSNSVSEGTKGSATAVPVITYDAQGHITEMTTSTIYPPTTVGTSGQYWKSDGSGTGTWQSLDTAPTSGSANAITSGGVHTSINALTTSVNNVQSNLDAEATARSNADTTLQNNINGVQSNLTQEIEDRADADETLQSNLDAEETARSNADTTLQNNINGVQSNLNAEVTARSNADATITTNLSNHIDDTTNPHSVTKSQVGLGNVDNTSDVNKPISTATQNALNTLTTAVNTVQSNLDAEETARASADTTLQTNINGKVSKSGDTMTGELWIERNYAGMGLNRGTSGNSNFMFNATINDVNTTVMRIRNITDETKNRMQIHFTKPDGSSLMELFSIVNEGTTFYATAPTPSDKADNSTKIATTSWISTADCIVHKTGNETVAGEKVFTTRPIVQTGSNSGLIVKSTDFDRTATFNSWTRPFQIVTYDKNGQYVSIIQSYAEANNRRGLDLILYSANSIQSILGLKYDETSKVGYGVAPTTPSSATSNEIATANWCIGKFVDLSSNQTIAGTKTFTASEVISKASDRDRTEKVGSGNGWGFTICDRDGEKVSAFYNEMTPTSSATCIYALAENDKGEQIYNAFKLVVNTDGTSYGTAPSWSVGTNDNSDKILTIKMANSLPSLLHSTGNETVAGNKIFNDDYVLHSVVYNNNGYWNKLITLPIIGSTTQMNVHLELIESYRAYYSRTTIARLMLTAVQGGAKAEWISVTGSESFDPTKFKAVFTAEGKTELWYYSEHNYWSCTCRVINSNKRNSPYNITDISMETSAVTTVEGTDVPIGNPKSAISTPTDATGTEIATANWSLGKFVKKTGDTMTGDLVRKSTQYENNDFVQTRHVLGEYEFQDKNGVFSGYLRRVGSTASQYTQLGCLANIDGATVSSTLEAHILPDGTAYCNAISWNVGTNDNSDKILTTKMANSFPSLVHTTGNETIAGEKTFTGNITIANNLYMPFCIKHINLDSTTVDSQESHIYFRDKNDVLLGRVSASNFATKTFGLTTLWNNTWHELAMKKGTDGTVYAIAPTTYSGATGNQIATADWSLGKFVQKSGDTMAGNLTVEGVFSTPKGNRGDLSQVGGESTYGKWYRVASVSAITELYNDSHLMLGVWDNYNYNGYPVVRTGILNVHVRRANTSFTGNIRFILAGSEIDNDAYALVTYSDYSAELYAQQTNSYGRPSFTRLNPTEDTNKWVMHRTDIVKVDSLDSLGGTITYAGLPVIEPPTSSSDNGNTPATTGWVNTADSVVHKTGNETIAGTKTFSNNITTYTTSYRPIVITKPNSDITADDGAECFIMFYDDNDASFGRFGISNGANKVFGLSQKWNNTWYNLGLVYKNGGALTSQAPPTPSDANSNEIATANWVNNKLAYVEVDTTNEYGGSYTFKITNVQDGAIVSGIASYLKQDGTSTNVLLPFTTIIGHGNVVAEKDGVQLKLSSTEVIIADVSGEVPVICDSTFCTFRAVAINF